MNNLSAKARITEIDGLTEYLLDIYKKEVGLANDEFLKEQFEELEKLSNVITNAIKRDRAQSNIEEKDAARDEAIRNLGDMLVGYAAFPMPDKKEAALALKATFDKYGKQIIYESHVNETSFIESLLADLETKEAKEHISKLDGIATVISTIRTTQAEFRSVYADWAKTQSIESKAVSASSMKKPIVEIINNKIVPYLTAMGYKEAYQDFAKTVDKEIGKINGAISSRSNKGAKA